MQKNAKKKFTDFWLDINNDDTSIVAKTASKKQVSK